MADDTVSNSKLFVFLLVCDAHKKREHGTVEVIIDDSRWGMGVVRLARGLHTVYIYKRKNMDRRKWGTMGSFYVSHVHLFYILVFPPSKVGAGHCRRGENIVEVVHFISPPPILHSSTF